MTGSIVLQVCNEFKIHPVEFFNPLKRERRLVKARLYAINRLHEAGFCMAGIARMMRRNHSTIRYWMRPAVRAYKRRQAIEHHRKSKMVSA